MLEPPTTPHGSYNYYVIYVQYIYICDPPHEDITITIDEDLVGHSYYPKAQFC